MRRSPRLLESELTVGPIELRHVATMKQRSIPESTISQRAHVSYPRVAWPRIGCTSRISRPTDSAAPFGHRFLELRIASVPLKAPKLQCDSPLPLPFLAVLCVMPKRGVAGRFDFPAYGSRRSTMHKQMPGLPCLEIDYASTINSVPQSWRPNVATDTLMTRPSEMTICLGKGIQCSVRWPLGHKIRNSELILVEISSDALKLSCFDEFEHVRAPQHLSHRE